MNKAIEKAKGDYLLFLNSGDYLINDRILEEINNELDSIDIIYGNVFLIESVTKSWTGVYPDILNFQHFVDSSLPHPCSFIKRCVFDVVGRYDESLKIVADWKFFLDAICRYNVSYKHIDKTISIFLHDGLSSLAKNQPLMQEEKRSVLSNGYPAFLENSKELTQLRAFRNNPFISKFAKAARAVGLLKGL
jgi:glycosyltransferase involved in cell wall biosynthesis